MFVKFGFHMWSIEVAMLDIFKMCMWLWPGSIVQYNKFRERIWVWCVKRERMKFGEEDYVKIMQCLDNSFKSNKFEKQEFPWKSKAIATLVVGYMPYDLLWTWKYVRPVEVVFGLVQFVELEPKFVEDWGCFY